MNTSQRFSKSDGHISWSSPCLFAPRGCLFFSVKLFDARQPWNRNTISFCQPKDNFAGHQPARPFPVGRRRLRYDRAYGQFLVGQIFPPAAQGVQVRESNIPNEVSHAAFEGFSQFCQCFEGNFLFRALDVADVISRQVSLLCQLFLAPTRLFPLGANGFPQNAIYFARRWMHSCPSNQNGKIELPTSGWHFRYFVLDQE